MSCRLSPATPRPKPSKVTAGEVDTPPPFQSVKAAVNLFGDKGPKSAERRSSKTSSVDRRFSSDRGTELQLAQEELLKTKEELILMESAKVQAQQESSHLKGLVDELTMKLTEALERSVKDRLRANKVENASFTAAEDWQAELEAMKRQYEAEVHDLQGVKRAYEEMKLECVAATNEKEEAVRLAGEAMTAADAAAKQAEFLSVELAETKAFLSEASATAKKVSELLAELSATKAALVEAYATCQSAPQADKAMMTGKETDIEEAVEVLFQVKNEPVQFQWELSAAKKLEPKLCEMNLAFEDSKSQIAANSEEEHHQSHAATDAHGKPERATSEDTQARLAELEALSLLASVRVELEETQQKWSRASAEVVTLTASLHSLTQELERNQTQILILQEKESNAVVEAAASTAKLIEASGNLDKALLREASMEDNVKSLKSSLEEANLELQSLRQQLAMTNLEAQKEVMEANAVRGELFLLTKAVEAAQIDAEKARTDLQAATHEIKMAREIAAVGLSVEQRTHQTIKKMSASLQEAKICSQQAMQAFETNVEVEEELREAAALRDEVSSLVEILLAAQEGAQQTDSDLQVARGELLVSRAEAEAARVEANAEKNEAMHARREAELAQKDLSLAKAEILAEQEQASHAREEAQAATKEVKVAQLNSDEAMSAANVSERKLQNILREIEAAKLSGPNTPDQNKGIRDKSREFSESWEMVESGSDVGITITQEELETLKMKLQEAEEFKTSIKIEFDSLKTINEKLSTKLDTANFEIEVLKVSEKEACQQFERAENEKLSLEDEVQRLTSRGENLLLKGWEIGPESTKTNGNVIPLGTRDRTLQQQYLGRLRLRDLASKRKDEGDGDEESGELHPLSTKKKKKALLSRIGTYLTKRNLYVQSRQKQSYLN